MKNTFVTCLIAALTSIVCTIAILQFRDNSRSDRADLQAQINIANANAKAQAR